MKKLIEHLEYNISTMKRISKYPNLDKNIAEGIESLPNFEKALKWIKILDTEEDIIIDAINQYLYEANSELSKNNLGDIERKNWEGIKERLTNILKELN